jgi:hypothetical protein
LDTGTDNAKMATALAIAGRVDNTGWTPARETWQYASATTITVPSGAVSKYSVGTKIRYQNNDSGTYLYDYVIGVADTLLTVVGDAVPNATLTDNYYSNAVSPVGFPSNGFSLGTPTWTTSGTAFTNQPIENDWRFVINGGLVTLNGQARCHATSGGTGVFTATWAAGLLPRRSLTSVGPAMNFNTSVLGTCYNNNFDLVLVSKYDGTTIATNGEYFGLSITYRL